LHLTKNVTQPGTFTIDPGRGVIKIYPYSNTNTVTISYYKSSQTIKPIGVLASDLLTFAPLTSLLDLQIGKTIFSIDGSPQEKVLYIPKVKFGPIAGSANEVGFTATTQLLYNNKDEDILLSTMIELESINKYITPAINKITLSIK
jgi:hypothetical protein